MMGWHCGILKGVNLHECEYISFGNKCH